MGKKRARRDRDEGIIEKAEPDDRELDDRSSGRREFVRRLAGGLAGIGSLGRLGAIGGVEAAGGVGAAGGVRAVRHLDAGGRDGTVDAPSTSGAEGESMKSVDTQQESPVGRLDHVAVPIQNVDEMIAFYRALGFEVRDGDPIVSVHFRDQKINFHRPELWQRETFTLRASAARPPCGDFCWVWEGSEDSLREVLDRAGAEIVAEGERQGGRDGGAAVGQSLYTRDPDGNLLEFIRY